MTTTFIKLDSAQAVKEFVNIISKNECDFDLVSDKYIIDAKSLMGILSLDLSQKLQLNIHSDNQSILENIKPFIVD